LVVADIARACGYKNIVFIDDGENDYTCFEEVKPDNTVKIALGIGNNHLRAEIMNKALSLGFKLATLVHPSAIISSSVTIGEGSVVMPNVVVNAKASIGRGVILNTGSIIEHECIIGDFSHISPSVALAGNVIIGKHAHIGIGTNIIQNVKIGDNTIIGAGSTVVHDIGRMKKAWGAPCRIMGDLKNE